MDKAFRQTGRDLALITPLDRLAYVGNRAMGAISYEPERKENADRDRRTALDIAAVGREATQSVSGGDLGRAGASCD